MSDSINVIGPCGATYHFKSEYSGVLMQCPTCRKTYRVPDTAAEAFSPFQRYVMKKEGLLAQVEEKEKPLWQRTYEMRQEVWSLIESYEFFEGAKSVLVAERPRRFFNVLIYAGLTVVLFAYAADLRIGDWPGWGGIAAVFGFGFVLVALIALRFKFTKRHVVFRGPDRLRPEFYIRDMSQIEFPRARFRVEDTNGKTIGELTKPWIGDLLQSPWVIQDQDGKVLMQVREEALVLSLMRRLFFTKLWWFRTNFVLIDPASGEVCGEFKRVWKVQDRYILDLTPNTVEIDMRLMWALSVLLDSAERR